jgi:hypothetical protein
MSSNRIKFETSETKEELASWKIDYAELMQFLNSGVEALVDWYQQKLLWIWLEIYRSRFPCSSVIDRIEIDSGSYIYDSTWSSSSSVVTAIEQIPDDRIVAVLGQSTSVSKPRDKSRMHGFPKGGLSLVHPEVKNDIDRGHYHGRAIGGCEDINLFPQIASINRGTSKSGKIFRRMERYCEKNLGTHFFLRPFYHGISDHPAAIEFGIIRSDDCLWLGIFPNIEDLKHLQQLDKELIDLRKQR